MEIKKLNQINTIIFDLGKVLIKWDPRNMYKKIFDDEQKMNWFLEHICDPQWNEEQDAGRTIALATKLKVAQFPDYKKEIEAFYNRWDEMLDGPIEGTVELFKTLRNNEKYKIYALTNWSNETFPIALERFEFLNWFDGIVVSGDEKTRKPFPEIYNILINRYQVNPAEAIFIDDSLRNVNAGIAQGIDSIHFTAPEALKLELEKRNLL